MEKFLGRLWVGYGRCRVVVEKCEKVELLCQWWLLCKSGEVALLLFVVWWASSFNKWVIWLAGKVFTVNGDLATTECQHAT